jgi:hypothetical protein
VLTKWCTALLPTCLLAALVGLYGYRTISRQTQTQGSTLSLSLSLSLRPTQREWLTLSPARLCVRACVRD